MGLYGNFYKITIEWQCVTFEDALIVNTYSGTVHFFIVPKCYVSDIRIQVAACPQTSPVKKTGSNNCPFLSDTCILQDIGIS
jgi:hypothetical protein